MGKRSYECRPGHWPAPGLERAALQGASPGFNHRVLTALGQGLAARLLDVPRCDLQHGHSACPSKMKRGSRNGAGKKEARAASCTI